MKLVVLDARGLPLPIPVLHVKVARTPEERYAGVSFWTQFSPWDGMIFFFDAEQTAGMVNRNTYLPLTVLYLDRGGVVVDLRDMRTIVESGGALEMAQPERPYWSCVELPRGRFGVGAVQVGDQVVELRA